MTDAGVTWTDERVELLKKLWAEGLSASQIAAEIGNVTRNAVIGKVHRLGLSGRAKTPPKANAVSPAPDDRASRRRTPSAPASIVPGDSDQRRGGADRAEATNDRGRADPTAHDDLAIPMSERVTIMDLRESMCRWPMGDPTQAGFPLLRRPLRPRAFPIARTMPASPTSRWPIASATGGWRGREPFAPSLDQSGNCRLQGAGFPPRRHAALSGLRANVSSKE